MKLNFVPKKPLVPQMPNAALMTDSPADFQQRPLATLDAPSQNSVPAYQSLEPIDQRDALAKSVLEQGMDSSPTKGGIGEGLARLGKSLVGGILLNRANDQRDKAVAGNRQNVMDAYQRGDLGALVTSENPVAQKLGSAIIEQNLKKKSGHYSKRPDGTEVWESDDGEEAPRVISRPNFGVPKDYRWNGDGTNLEPIPGGPADPAIIARNAGKRRAPPKADESGLAPWQRKW